MVTLDDVRAARERIAGSVHVTPVFGSTTLERELGLRLAFKAELFQKTGSFKPRGALNKIFRLGPAERARGLVTTSAGNHAAALGYAASAQGVACTVVMPHTANPTKVRACEAYGAHVILHGDVSEAFARAHELERDEGLVFVHPFDDPHIVAGAGTLGLELVEQVPDLQAVIVPVGGGGLIAGVATAVKALLPHVRVYGVEPEGAASMVKSLREGHAARLEKVSTVADGLAPPMAGELNYEIVRRLAEDVVTVSDEQIIDAMKLAFTRLKLAVEPAGAAGLAALVSGAVRPRVDGRVVVVLSGGNLDMQRLKTLL
jgi:threonine dehydratase